MANDQEALNALLRRNFHAFVQKVFETINGGALLIDNWHIEAMAWHLEQCFKGNIKRLIITLPPRHLKSLVTSVAFPIWCLGHDPTLDIIAMSYGEDLAYDFSRRRRKCMKELWYPKAFPNTKISKSKDTEREIVTTKGGSIFATSIGGSLTGRGGNIIIIDDPIKTGDATSEAERQSVNQHYSDTIYSRLNNKSEDVMIIVMQRVHADDLVGHVLERDDWTVLNLPAIALEEQTIRINEECVYTFGENAVLHEDWENRETLKKIRTTIGSYNFASQYSQSPVPPAGNMIKGAWFKRFRKRLAVAEYDKIIQSWDTGIATSEDASYSVCITAGIRDGTCNILDVFRDRLEFYELEKKAQQLAHKWTATHILIERAASGISLIQNLRRHTRLPVIEVPPKLDKLTRVAGVSGFIEAGRVAVPMDAHWLLDFLREVLDFPGGKHDDQVDALTHLLRWFDTPQIPIIDVRVIAIDGRSSVQDNYFSRTGIPTFRQ